MFILCRQLSVAMKKTSGGQMGKHHLAALFMGAKQGENPSGGVLLSPWERRLLYICG